MRKKLNKIWGRKVCRSNNFVVLTDEESAMNLIGVDPASFNDLVKLTAQSQALRIFRSKLDKLITQHDKQVADFNRKGGHVIVNKHKIQPLEGASETTDRVKRKRGSTP